MSNPIDDVYPFPCSEWEEKLACIQQLDDDERVAVNEHLKQCDRCSATLNAYHRQNEAIHLLYAARPLYELPPQLVRLWERRAWWNNVLDYSLSWRRPLGIAGGFVLLTYVVSQVVTHMLKATPTTTIVVTLSVVLVVVLSCWLISRMIAKLMQRETYESDSRNHLLPLLESEEGMYAHLAQKGVAKVRELPFISARHTTRQTSFYNHLGGRETQRSNRRGPWQRRELLLTLFLSLLAIPGSLLLSLLLGGTPSNTAIRAVSMGDTLVGISDGRFSFDVKRTDGYTKQLAGEKLATRDVHSAQALWSAAIAEDSNDAEALIYQENQQVLTSGRSYMTFIVGTIFSSGYTGLSRDMLQGAYVSQKAFNDQNTHGFQVVLLIANTGSDAHTTGIVAQQIVQVAQNDPSFLGVMGWPTSDTALAATKVLEAAHIPLISATASSDALTGISPYFFRVSPSDSDQAIAAAQYVKEVLQVKRIVVLSDTSNTYSRTLGAAFLRQFTTVSMLTHVSYTVGQPQTIKNSLPQITAASPDLIYFAGYAQDLSVLLTSLPRCQSASCVPIMGGDGLYSLGDYAPQVHIYAHLYFTAFAYPDEWNIFHLNAPSFFEKYTSSFDPNNLHQQSPYGYRRADGNTILAYDAIQTLIKAAQTASLQQGKRATPQMTRQSLAKINGSAALQGVSGQISFGSNGTVQDKAVVMLFVNDNGLTQLKTVFGRFLKSD